MIDVYALYILEFTPIFYMAPYAEEQGISGHMAGLLVALYGAGGLTGRTLTGTISYARVNGIWLYLR